MASDAVVAVVNYKGKVLLGKKREASPKFLAGQWHLPGEVIEEFESDYGALVRCLKEEADIDIRVGKYIGSSISPTSKRKVRWYECFLSTDKVKPRSDLEDIKWVPRREVLNFCSKEAMELWPSEIVDYFN